MSPNVVAVDPVVLRARREALLCELGMSADEFRELAATSTLTGAERDAKQELDEIAFLLGDDSGGG